MSIPSCGMGILAIGVKLRLAPICQATLSPNQLSNLLTISPQPGDDDKVLFARVFIGGQLILTKYSEDSDWRDIALQALANVKTANQDAVDQPF